jgi:hypothetical protein
VISVIHNTKTIKQMVIAAGIMTAAKTAITKNANMRYRGRINLSSL